MPHLTTEEIQNAIHHYRMELARTEKFIGEQLAFVLQFRGHIEEDLSNIQDAIDGLLDPKVIGSGANLSFAAAKQNINDEIKKLVNNGTPPEVFGEFKQELAAYEENLRAKLSSKKEILAFISKTIVRQLLDYALALNGVNYDLKKQLIDAAVQRHDIDAAKLARIALSDRGLYEQIKRLVKQQSVDLFLENGKFNQEKFDQNLSNFVEAITSPDIVGKALSYDLFAHTVKGLMDSHEKLDKARKAQFVEMVLPKVVALDRALAAADSSVKQNVPENLLHKIEETKKMFPAHFSASPKEEQSGTVLQHVDRLNSALKDFSKAVPVAQKGLSAWISDFVGSLNEFKNTLTKAANAVFSAASNMFSMFSAKQKSQPQEPALAPAQRRSIKISGPM